MSKGSILGQQLEVPDNPRTIASNVSYNNSSTSSIITGKNVQTAIDQLFTSVSNGKKKIASAITGKGVSTSANDSFDTMAHNISAINVLDFFSDIDAFNSNNNNYLYKIMNYGGPSTLNLPIFSSNCPISYTPCMLIAQFVSTGSSTQRFEFPTYIVKINNNNITDILTLNIFDVSVAGKEVEVEFSKNSENLYINLKTYTSSYKLVMYFVPDLSNYKKISSTATFSTRKWTNKDYFNFNFNIPNFTNSYTDFIKISKINKWSIVDLYDKEPLSKYKNYYKNEVFIRNYAIPQVLNCVGRRYVFDENMDTTDGHGFRLTDAGFGIFLDNNMYGAYGASIDIDLSIDMYVRK